MTTVRLQVILTVPLEDGAEHDQVRRGVLTTLVGLPVVNAPDAWAEIAAVEIQTSALQHEPGLSPALAAADVPVDRSDFLDPGKTRDHRPADCDRELRASGDLNPFLCLPDSWTCSCGHRYVHICDEAEGCFYDLDDSDAVAG